MAQCLPPMSASSKLQPPTPPNSRDSARPAGRSGPGSYQMTAFELVQVQMRFCVRPLKMSLFPPVLWGLYGQMLVFPAPDLEWGARRGAQNSHSCGRSSAIYSFCRQWVLLRVWDTQAKQTKFRTEESLLQDQARGTP